MPVTQNPSAIVKVGFNGITKTGYILDTYDHSSDGDIERVSSNGSILTYLISDKRDVITISLLVSAVSGSSGNVQPPAKGATFTLTCPTTSSELDEDGLSSTALEFIVIEAKASRVAGKSRLDLTLERPSGMDFT